MSFEYSQEAINDYEKLLEIDEGYDVIIYAGENANVKEIHAHSIILRIRSEYFRTEFVKEKKKDGKFIFNKPNISPLIFKIIIRFIYCGKIDLTKLQGPDILKLLMAVNELEIHTLISCIQKYLIKHRNKFLQQNPIEILETIYQHETFTDLWNFFLKNVCEKPDILFNSDKFVSLKAPLLESLLKRDDLLLDEIDIWDNLIKWSLAQHPSILSNSSTTDVSGLSEDDITSLIGMGFTRNQAKKALGKTNNDIESAVVWLFNHGEDLDEGLPSQSGQNASKKWNKEEITIMERTIHRFIPLIRFYHISQKNFRLKVYPFKAILPEDLIDNLLTFYMVPDEKLSIDILPPRKPKCVYNSVIIESQHFAVFASWIEKKNDFHYNIRNNPYHFNLLYRASRDGNTAEAFHAKCDNKGATMVIVKFAERIVGGYNPFFWNSDDSWRSTNDSFIFVFTNKANLQTAKMVYSNGNKYSIGYLSGSGPVFGNQGNLNFFEGKWNFNYKGICYPEIDDTNVPKQFKADDYEVFQVVKK